MGGQGSGGWNLKYEHTTDDVLRLDLTSLRRKGCFDWPFHCRLTWSINGIVQLDLSAQYKERALHLCDATAGKNPDTDPYGQRIDFVTRTPTVGGLTMLFKCPCCYKARAHLYLHDPFFICRECAGVTYKSRRENNPIRAFRKWGKLSKKLGGIKMDQWYYAPKPKGMHQKTFDRLKQEISQVEAYIEQETLKSLRR